ncbi:MAG: hypothetical protein LQ348_007050 [Seirophora lacunosa]|nr:MAG: hypothetical protein LQ348_007050 [Seirophora lacunosa]
MGDPLSVGASAVGIISLGLTVSNGLLDYYTAFKDQPADVAQMIQSLQTLSHILEAIDRKVQHPLLNREAVHHVTESLISCVAGIHILQAKLEKIRNTKPGKCICSPHVSLGDQILARPDRPVFLDLSLVAFTSRAMYYRHLNYLHHRSTPLVRKEQYAVASQHLNPSVPLSRHRPWEPRFLPPTLGRGKPKIRPAETFR